MKIVVWICWRHVLNNCPNILRFLLRFRFFSRFYRKSSREMCDVVLVWIGSTKIKPWMEFVFLVQAIFNQFLCHFSGGSVLTNLTSYIYIYILYIHTQYGRKCRGTLNLYCRWFFSPSAQGLSVYNRSISVEVWILLLGNLPHRYRSRTQPRAKQCLRSAALSERVRTRLSLMGIWCG